VKLGPFTINDVNVSFSPNPDTNRMDNDGVLGAGVLRRFKVIVAYARGSLILVPGRTFAEPTRTDRSGMAVRAEGAELHTYRVIFVRPGAPASDAGVEAGDELVSIAGRSAHDITLDEVVELLKRDQPIELKLRRGEVVMTKRLPIAPPTEPPKAP
jgi:hypothetical protein